MTDQITVPRETWDLVVGALKQTKSDLRAYGFTLYNWHKVVSDAITAANAVSEPKGLFVDLIASHGPEFVAEIAAIEPQAQREIEEWLDANRMQKIGSLHHELVALFVVHLQATEPAAQDSLMEKAYERGWIECACWANRDDLRADVGSPAYLADRAPHLDAVRNGWPLGCEKCIDPDGIPCFPQYGVGPHTCFYKIPGAKVGESHPLPKDQWPENYREDPDCPGMGVYWCPHCGSGKPASQVPTSPTTPQQSGLETS